MIEGRSHMTFEEYLNDAWSRHGTDSTELLKKFKNHFSLINSSDEINQMGYLIAHVSGEHLGQWGRGIQLLNELRDHPKAVDKTGLNRFIAALALGDDETFSLDDFSDSDKVRIYAMTASALAAQNDPGRASFYLAQAEKLCHSNLANKDPAHRNLAIASNNLAVALHEKEELSHEEINLMIHAAFLSRKFWEIAGTWSEIERAEYWLAKTFLKANILDKAYAHAERCLEIISEHGNDPIEVFFGMEVMGQVEEARNNHLGKEQSLKGMKDSFAKMSPDDQKWCRETFDKMAGG